MCAYGAYGAYSVHSHTTHTQGERVLRVLALKCLVYWLTEGAPPLFGPVPFLCLYCSSCRVGKYGLNV